LTALDLSDGKIGDEGASCLAQGLVGSAVRRLDLSLNSVGARGVGELGTMLAQDSALEILILSQQSNREARAGIPELAAGLPGNSRLRELWLGYLKLGNHDAVALAEGVGANRGLAVLHLGGNRIEVAGSQALAGMLLRNRGLEQLTLDGNPMGDQCIAALAEAVRANHTLRKLSLINMSCGPKAYPLLERALEENTHLEKLAFSVAPPTMGPPLPEQTSHGVLTLKMQQQLNPAARLRKRRRWLFRGFLLGLHPRIGAASPVLWLPLQAVETIHTFWLEEFNRQAGRETPKAAYAVGQVGAAPGAARRAAPWPPRGVG